MVCLLTKQNKQTKKGLQESTIPSHSPNKEATVPNTWGITLVILIFAILIVMKY